MVELVQLLMAQPDLQGYFSFIPCLLLAQLVATPLQVAPVVRLPEQEETGGKKARACPEKALPKAQCNEDGSQEERLAQAGFRHGIATNYVLALMQLTNNAIVPIRSQARSKAVPK